MSSESSGQNVCSLVAGILDSEADAVAELGRCIHMVANGMYLDLQHHDREEVLQIAAFKAWQRIKQFDGDTNEQLLGWLSSIVRNTIRDFAKYNGRLKRDHCISKSLPEDSRGSVALSYDTATPGTRLVSSEIVEQGEKLLSTLSEEAQYVVKARFENRPYAQIAAVLGQTSDNVRQLYFRSLQKLKKLSESADE